MTLAEVIPIIISALSLLSIASQYGYNRAVVSRLVKDREDDRYVIDKWKEEVEEDIEQLKLYRARQEGRS